MQWSDIWVPAGIVFAFQIQMVRWRIDRELRMEAESERVWFPLCDWLNLLSMMVTAAFVFVLPMLGWPTTDGALVLARTGFGLSVVLLIGYLLALIGHYRLFFPRKGPRPLSTLQEWSAVIVTLIFAALYVAHSGFVDLFNG